MPASIHIGMGFGRWRVIAAATPSIFPSRPNNPVNRWLCVCQCGTERIVLETSLLAGTSVSCGCFNRERSSQIHSTHKLCDTAEYRTWEAMNQRSHNPKNSRYSDYGGRGIFVCDKWRTDFIAFLTDVGPKPSPRHSIDRIDNSRGYEPGNCTWSLPHHQMTNRRCTRYVQFNGKSMPLATLAKEYGIPANTLRGRIVMGWDVMVALTHPVRFKKTP